jgi:hypothetical protein
MELYIRIHNGQPKDHPILGDNFRQAFPEIDTDALPDHFAPFKRKPHPSVEALGGGPYQMLEVTYVLDTDGVTWTDSFSLRDMTADEKAEKIAAYRNSGPTDWPSWTFNETLCLWQPPTPMPSDTSKTWAWDEPTLSWKDVTPPPIALVNVSFK